MLVCAGCEDYEGCEASGQNCCLLTAGVKRVDLLSEILLLFCWSWWRVEAVQEDDLTYINTQDQPLVR